LLSFRTGVAVMLLASMPVPPAVAQSVDERLAAYTGRNAKGYVAPLVDAFRSNINSGLFHAADIPPRGFYVSLEVNAMATFFGDDSRTFTATTEGDFLPEQSAEAPTLVGDNAAVFVDGEAGTQFAFPGGFNIDNVWFACPQVRVGSWRGTEALGRLILYDTGVSELGGLTVWGAGVRHSVSQYIASMHPFDLAVAVLYQDAWLEDEHGQSVVTSDVWSASAQSGVALDNLYPYFGVTVNWFDLGVDYEFEEDIPLDPIRLDFEYDTEFQLTLGMAYRVGGFSAYGEYNFADQSSLAAGLSVTLPFNGRSATP
jgi:hypothetical protein